MFTIAAIKLMEFRKAYSKLEIIILNHKGINATISYGNDERFFVLTVPTPAVRVYQIKQLT